VKARSTSPALYRAACAQPAIVPHRHELGQGLLREGFAVLRQETVRVLVPAADVERRPQHDHAAPLKAPHFPHGLNMDLKPTIAQPRLAVAYRARPR
jgi:hypothetical protein